ncbi:site-2 protease family protein [Salegentibacter sp. HM20]
MKWSLSLGSIAGIKISVHWTFLILLIWIFLIYYRIDYNLNQAFTGVLFIILLFACVLLHELGHALTAKKYQINTKSIILLPIGGLARLERIPEKPAQELVVAIAGPLVNLVIAAVLFVVVFATDNFPDFGLMNEPGVYPQINFWFQLLLANLILFLFNLIPAFPMDGGRVLRALLAFKLNREKATRIAAAIGQFLAILFVLAGFFGNIFLIFIGVFIYLGAGAEASFESTKFALSQYKVSDVMMKNFISLSAEEALEKAVELLLDGQAQEFVITRDEEVVGLLSRKLLIKGLAENGKDAGIATLIHNNFLSFEPDLPLSEAYRLLLENKAEIAPVLEDGKLLGIVDRENINEFLMVKEALKQYQS